MGYADRAACRARKELTNLIAYLTLADRYRVHTICDVNTPRAKAFAANTPGSVVSNDMASVIANPDLDIVDACLPPHLHYEACSQALTAGKHIISERPLVSSLRDADRLIELCRSCTGSLFPFFNTAMDVVRLRCAN